MQRRQQIEEEARLAIAAAHAYLAGELEPAVAVDAEEQRGDGVLAPSAAEAVAAHDEIVGLRRADLPPGGRALARQVRALLLFRDDPLQLLARHRIVEGDAIVRDEVSHLHDPVRRQALVQQGPALGERPLEQPAAVQLQQVEDLIADGRASRPGDGDVGSQEARAQQLRRGQPLGSPGDDLAVDDGVFGAQAIGERGQLRVDGREIAQVAPVQPHLAFVQMRDGAHTAPLHLEDVVRRVERLLEHAGEHRPELLVWGVFARTSCSSVPAWRGAHPALKVTAWSLRSSRPMARC